MNRKAVSIDLTSDTESSDDTESLDDESYFAAPLTPSSSTSLQSTRAHRQISNSFSSSRSIQSTQAPHLPPSQRNFTISNPVTQDPLRTSETDRRDWEKSCHELAILCEAQHEEILELAAQCEAQEETISGLKRKCRAEINNNGVLKTRVESLSREVKRLKEKRDRRGGRREVMLGFLEKVEAGTRDLLEELQDIKEKVRLGERGQSGEQ